jgi:hypothetical protein
MKVLESKKVEGLMLFWCPGCKGLHQVPTKHTHSQNWGFNGSLDAPTFTPSILTQNAPNGIWQTACHSFVNDGKIQFLSDCPHELSGQTVELDEIDKESRFYFNWERGNY